MPRTTPWLFIATAFLIASFASGADFFVAPNGLDGNAGTRSSPRTLAWANNELQPGDVAVLLDGTYAEMPIAPARSGHIRNAITYRAANRHKALFQEGVGPAAVIVSGRSHITIDGIKVVDVKRWVVGVKCDHITITNSHFDGGSGWINCRFEEIGDGICVTNNYFNEGTDLVSLDGGNGHLVEGNFFGDATHTGLVLLGVQRSIVRGNRLSNRRWRCMEVESQRHEPFRISEFNLIEKNSFDYSPCSAIQYAGNRSIIRQNTIRRCMQGMNWSNYLGSNKPPKKRSPEAWHNESNRFYNNLIAECGANDVVLNLIAEAESQGILVAERVAKTGHAMGFATNMFNPKLPDYQDCAYGDNVVVNNIFYRNQNSTEYADAKGKTASKSAQIVFDWNATPEFSRIRYNVISSGQANDAEVFYFLDAAEQKPPEPRNRSIASFQQRYPQWAEHNIDIDPQFNDSEQGDFHLSSSSLCIDAGGPLTETVSAGKGTVVQVVDALYFTDGHGRTEPDTIRLGSERVKIVRIDYATNELWLDSNLSWKTGAPVSMDYAGTAPDLGPFEFR